MSKPKVKQEFNGKKVTREAMIDREIKKLIKTPHGHFTVLSNSDRVLAIQIGGTLFRWGFLPFKLTSWTISKKGFRILREDQPHERT